MSRPMNITRKLDNLALLIDGSAATDALTFPSMRATPPTVGVLAPDGFEAVRFLFGGTAAANLTVNYQVILWYQNANPAGTTTYVPVLVASGVATLGAKAYGAGGAGVGATGNLLADTITNTLSVPGVVVVSPANDTMAMLIVDLGNAAWVQVETDCNDLVYTAASADVLAQRGTAEEVSEGTVTEASASAIKTLMDTTGIKILPADVTSLKTVTEASAADIKAQGVGLATALNGGSAISVSSVSATLAAVNTARKSVTITNLSLTRALTVQCDGTAVAGAGVVLALAADANHPGGTVTILGSEYTGIVTGIMNGADATANNVAVLEI